MARTKKSSKYKSHAGRMLSKIRKWCNKGNPNVQHHENLLLAEDAVLKGKRAIACKNYELAAMLAARRGFVQDAALANERYGEFLLREREADETEATFRLEEAVRLYKEWGAHTKANYMLKKHTNLWKVPKNVMTIQTT